jgi:hypothetical protein
MVVTCWMWIGGGLGMVAGPVRVGGASLFSFAREA